MQVSALNPQNLPFFDFSFLVDIKLEIFWSLRIFTYSVQRIPSLRLLSESEKIVDSPGGLVEGQCMESFSFDLAF